MTKTFEQKAKEFLEAEQHLRDEKFAILAFAKFLDTERERIESLENTLYPKMGVRDTEREKEGEVKPTLPPLPEEIDVMGYIHNGSNKLETLTAATVNVILRYLRAQQSNK